ncbi:DUF3606 domain-containing protein [Mucilaginibacter sp.]|uniref:DUF3606 domain-containing protein n=1 Tax=Mucilaginibacter sp. TaxID=1882438 RepID=UPI003D118758
MERKLRPKAEDTQTVDINDAYTLDFWAKEFNVTKEKLTVAVLAAGTNEPYVKRELKK